MRARLLNISKQRQQPNELLLTRYAIERLLYRLSITNHRERFVWRRNCYRLLSSLLISQPS